MSDPVYLDYNATTPMAPEYDLPPLINNSLLDPLIKRSENLPL